MYRPTFDAKIQSTNYIILTFHLHYLNRTASFQAKMSQPKLTADYSSPSATKSFSSDLPSIPKDNVEDKTAYLAALRSNASSLQGELNAFLTQKMEEDKAAEGNSQQSAADEREEDFYGEEDPEKDG